MNNAANGPVKRSLKELQTTRGLVMCAMLLALRVLLNYVIAIQITPDIRITFGFLAIALTAQIFGPVPAMINAGLGDLISFVLRPTGPLVPGLTLSAAVGGLIYGMAFYGKHMSIARVATAKLITDLLCNILLNTLFLQQITGRGFIIMLPGRVLKNIVQFLPDVVLLMLMFSALRRVIKRPEGQAVKHTRKSLVALGIVLTLVLSVWANNTNLLAKRGENGQYRLLAHRGVAQTFDMANVQYDTDTSKIIHPPQHEYLENTIASMRAAFDMGADIVELDVRLTKDGQLAVFHDYLLDYRANAQGPVSDYAMDELKTLDVGYGYTADGGQSWPFRGKGTGMMPELREVLDAFAHQDLLIHFKDDGDIGERAADVFFGYVKGFDAQRLSRLSAYGSNAAIDALKGKLPWLRVMSEGTLKSNMLQYLALGWTGYIPESMKHTQIHLPIKYGFLVWGWPYKFMERMDKVDTRVVLVAGDGTYSEGFDDPEALEQIPPGFTGYVWTNRIGLQPSDNP